MMYLKKYPFSLKKTFLFLPIILILPFIVIFDSLIYFITRPSCLTCWNLVEFLKTASLTTFILSSQMGYKFKNTKQNG